MGYPSFWKDPDTDAEAEACTTDGCEGGIYGTIGIGVVGAIVEAIVGAIVGGIYEF